MDDIIIEDGKQYRVTHYSVDFGPKNGVAHVLSLIHI